MKILLISLIVSSYMNACCCVPLIDMLITKVETKLNTVIRDDNSSIDKLINKNDYLNDEYLSDLTTEIKSTQLNTIPEFSKFLVEQCDNIYQANAKVDGFMSYVDDEQFAHIEDVIEAKLTAKNLNILLSKQNILNNKQKLYEINNELSNVMDNIFKNGIDIK